ncbi:hypothetical protein M513_12477 [Trichuris suis]|uniref:Uncharacterized protein n=1 Tax=Trichuris suis TaxID=68888 RepID=A0A085LNS6_9BILA|nr:hypothetical protein M513_12477 [Trichuris suis]
MDEAVKASAIVEHASHCDGQPVPQVICHEEDFQLRKIKEALFIRHNEVINRDKGRSMEAESDVWASAQVAACSTTAELTCACFVDLSGASVWGRPLDLKVSPLSLANALQPPRCFWNLSDTVPSFAYVGRSALAVDPVNRPSPFREPSFVPPTITTTWGPSSSSFYSSVR